MIENDEINKDELEKIINDCYKNGKSPDNNSLLKSIMENSIYFEKCRELLSDINSSEYLTHFAILSMRNHLKDLCKKINIETIYSCIEWCLGLLFQQSNRFNTPLLKVAFGTMLGYLYSSAFSLLPEFKLSDNIIQSFLSGDQSQICIFSSIFTSIIEYVQTYSCFNISRIHKFTESTIFQILYFGICFIQKYANANIDDENIISSGFDLITSCLSFNFDSSKESSKIYFPETWNEIYENIPFLLSFAFRCYHSNTNEGSIVPKKSLHLIYCLESLRLPANIHQEFLNILLSQIILFGDLFYYDENIGSISYIILKASYLILFPEIKNIVSYKPFINYVYKATLNLINVDMFHEETINYICFLKFWYNFTLKVQRKSKKFKAVAYHFYNVLNETVCHKINLFTNDISSLTYQLSFIYKIENNDNEFFQFILSNFQQSKNDFLNNSENFENELKLSLNFLILITALIRKFALPETFIENAMISVLFFLNETQENFGKILRNSLIEYLIIYFVEQIEKSDIFIERTFLANVIINTPLKRIEQLHVFFLQRLLTIVKFYKTSKKDDQYFIPPEQVISYVFNTIGSFYSLRSDDQTIILIVDHFLNDFLYVKKMQLSPNKKDNYFQKYEWSFYDRIKFHEYIGTIFSIIAERNDLNFSMEIRKIKPYLFDLKNRIIKTQNTNQYSNNITDIIGLFKGANNSPMYILLYETFFQYIINSKISIHQSIMLKFFSEITNNKNNRILFPNHSINGLIISKTSISFLIDCFTSILRNIETVPLLLKNSLKIIFNLISNDYSCIGALIAYNDPLFDNFLFSYFSYIQESNLLELYQIPKAFFELMKLSNILLSIQFNDIYNVISKYQGYVNTILQMCYNFIVNYNDTFMDKSFHQVFEVLNSTLDLYNHKSYHTFFSITHLQLMENIITIGLKILLLKPSLSNQTIFDVILKECLAYPHTISSISQDMLFISECLNENNIPYFDLSRFLILLTDLPTTNE